MKVIVALISDPELEEYENPIDIKVRKCPPNYEQRYSSKQVEWIVELDDYTEEDVDKYFPEPGEEQFISLMVET
jgi:hypothetical protein